MAVECVSRYTAERRRKECVSCRVGRSVIVWRAQNEKTDHRQRFSATRGSHDAESSGTECRTQGRFTGAVSRLEPSHAGLGGVHNADQRLPSLWGRREHTSPNRPLLPSPCLHSAKLLSLFLPETVGCPLWSSSATSLFGSPSTNSTSALRR